VRACVGIKDRLGAQVTIEKGELSIDITWKRGCGVSGCEWDTELFELGMIHAH
jgi:hypothetical protein